MRSVSCVRRDDDDVDDEATLMKWPLPLTSPIVIVGGVGGGTGSDGDGPGGDGLHTVWLLRRELHATKLESPLVSNAVTEIIFYKCTTFYELLRISFRCFFIFLQYYVHF